MNTLLKMLRGGAVCLALALPLLACQNKMDQGFNRAQNAFAQQNYGVSFHALNMAANYGDARSQYALGYLYYYGIGTAQDIPLATRWFNKAAGQGLLQARVALNQIHGGTVYKREVNLAMLKPPPAVSAPAQAAVNLPSFHDNDLRQHARSNKRKNVQAQNNGRQRAQKKVNSASPAPPRATRRGRQAKKSLPSPRNTRRPAATDTRGSLTVRLYRNQDLQKVQQYVHSHGLSGQARIHKRNKLYEVLYGHYHTVHQAKGAIKKLPAAVQRSNPWIQAAPR